MVNHTSAQNAREGIGDIPSSSKESDTMSKDLRKRGFKFVGTTAVRSRRIGPNCDRREAPIIALYFYIVCRSGTESS